MMILSPHHFGLARRVAALLADGLVDNSHSSTPAMAQDFLVWLFTADRDDQEEDEIARRAFAAGLDDDRIDEILDGLTFTVPAALHLIHEGQVGSIEWHRTRLAAATAEVCNDLRSWVQRYGEPKCPPRGNISPYLKCGDFKEKHRFMIDNGIEVRVWREILSESDNSPVLRVEGFCWDENHNINFLAEESKKAGKPVGDKWLPTAKQVKDLVDDTVLELFLDVLLIEQFDMVESHCSEVDEGGARCTFHWTYDDTGPIAAPDSVGEFVI